MTGAPTPICLATVTDDSYLPGTTILLASFLRHNPWFTGSIVIIDDGLLPENRARLQRFPNLRFHTVSDALKERLALVGSAHPLLARKRPILSALEVFNLSGYEAILKVDSDVLCAGSVETLMDGREALRACPDQSYFRDEVRNRRSYVSVARSSAAEADVLAATFNAGVLAIAPPRLASSTYADLVDLVQPATWSGVRTGHSDSVVLNRYFEGRWTSVSERYNHLISSSANRFVRPRISLAEAALIHFLGRPKPWQLEPQALATVEGPRRDAFQLWLDEAAAYVASK